MKFLKWIFLVVGIVVAVLCVYLINKNGVPTFGTWNECDIYCTKQDGAFCPQDWKPGEPFNCIPAIKPQE